MGEAGSIRSGVVRAARREWGLPLRTVRTALVRRGWRAIPLTLAAVCLTGLLQVVQNQSWGLRPVLDLGGVRAQDPLWLALLRTPLSMFVPALDLPVWGALAQILVAFGIAEICVGRWRTVLIAYAATLAGTLYARLAIAFGPHGAMGPLGLPGSNASVIDTGPSAAVVGLAVYVCWHYRAWFTTALVVAAAVLELAVKDNLAGREHLAAILLVVAVCALEDATQRGGSGVAARFGSMSGAPPIQSCTRRRGPDQRRSRWYARSVIRARARWRRR